MFPLKTECIHFQVPFQIYVHCHKFGSTLEELGRSAGLTSKTILGVCDGLVLNHSYVDFGWFLCGAMEGVELDYAETWLVIIKV